jgi:hypothetical protein
MIAFILIALKPDFTPKQLNGYFHLFIAVSNERGQPRYRNFHQHLYNGRYSTKHFSGEACQSRIIGSQ